LVSFPLPSIPIDAALGEWLSRWSSLAIAWIAAVIARRDPQAIMASFHADAVVTNVAAMTQSLRLAYTLAEQGYLVTLGVKPTAPETGFGYIRYADQVGEGYGQRAFLAARFVEKPNLPTAQSYLKDGH